uniref:F-box protein SKIP23-like n=1 Tax=Nicotiana tabacum TaxID=4097 RepID=A0A1S4BD39_TOBAC|nr:PREDICTED: F-box protein SKIP23-like [Nicotiana tabacum]
MGLRRGSVISWSDLPEELVERIGKCLVDNPFDVLHFRAVCKTWRSSIPPFKSNSPDLSLQLPFPLDYHPNTFPGFYLIENTVYLFQLPPDRDTSLDCRGCWLVKVTKTADGKLQVFNPLNVSPDNNNNNNNMPKQMLKKDTQLNIQFAQQIGYTLHSFLSELPYVFLRATRHVCAVREAFATYALAEPGETVYMGNASTAKVEGYGKSWDGNWTILKDGSFRIVDIIVYKRNFVAVDRCGKTIEFDSSSFNETIVSPILHDRDTGIQPVESNGQLFLVDMVLDYNKTENVEFRIYQLDQELHKWIAVHSLGDGIFFISYDYCFSVSSQDFGHHCAGNCIYYADREEGELGPGLSFLEFEDLFWPLASRPSKEPPSDVQ